MIRATTTLGKKKEFSLAISGKRTKWTITLDEMTLLGIVFLALFCLSVLMIFMKAFVAGFTTMVVTVVVVVVVAQFLFARRAEAGGRPSYLYDYFVRKGLRGTRRGLIRLKSPVTIVTAHPRTTIKIFMTGASKTGQDLTMSCSLARSMKVLAAHDPIYMPLSTSVRACSRARLPDGAVS